MSQSDAILIQEDGMAVDVQFYVYTLCRPMVVRFMWVKGKVIVFLITKARHGVVALVISAT